MSDGEREVTSLRDWIKNQAEANDVNVEQLLLQSRKRDPMWKGTPADRKKAEWFARYWRMATQNSEGSVHCRGVHYTIYALDEEVAPPTRCSWDVYDNITECYSYLKDASVVARVLGTVPLDGVIDQKNDSTTLTHYEGHETTPETEFLIKPTGVHLPDIPEVGQEAKTRFETLEEFAEYAGDRWARYLSEEISFDEAAQQPIHVELWSEKTLPDESKELARDLGVNVVVEGQGDLSYSVASSLASRIEAAGKPAAILYVSDFDPKGDNMASAMSGKLAWLKQRGDLSQRTVVQQLAVTREQIRRFDLPRKPIDGSSADANGTGGKAYDTLVNEWEERKGAGATELQALWLDRGRFNDVIREGVRELRDVHLDVKNREALEEFREDVSEAIQEAILESDLDSLVDDLEDWVENFNEQLADASEVFEDLRDLRDEDRLQKWLATAEDVVEETETPEVDVPTGDGMLPDGALYDSARNYGENLSAVKRHKAGNGGGGR